MKKVKVSFLGDMMFELPLQQVKNEDKYNTIFESIHPFLKESEVVLGNLETIFAGKDAGYTSDLFSFNTPDAFAKSIKEAGIDVVSVANNHALDRGEEGLLRTMDVLNKEGIDFLGGSPTKERDAYYALELGDLKIGIIAYAYGTNVFENDAFLPKERGYLLNLIEDQEKKYQEVKSRQSTNLRGTLSRRLRKGLGDKGTAKLNKLLKRYKYPEYQDSLKKSFISEEWLRQLEGDISASKKDNDYTILYLHAGGQFNEEPGDFVEFIVNKARDAGVDSIVGHHPHVVQKSLSLKNGILAYSLGNFSLSPSSIYVNPKKLADYGIILHMYFNEKELESITFSIIKMVEERGMLKVVNTNDLSANVSEDVKTIYQRFTGNELEGHLQKEYMYL